MLLTKEQVYKLPEGTECKVFYSGVGWGDDFGKSVSVIKIQDKLYYYTGFDYIDGMDIDPEYTFEVAVKE